LSYTDKLFLALFGVLFIISTVLRNKPVIKEGLIMLHFWQRGSGFRQHLPMKLKCVWRSYRFRQQACARTTGGILLIDPRWLLPTDSHQLSNHGGDRILLLLRAALTSEEDGVGPAPTLREMGYN
jgi:hypothetical protein